MPHLTGTATNYLNLLAEVVDFLTTANTVTVPAPDAGNAGDGTMDQPTADPDAPSESWTVTCTDATTPGAEVWSVTGSVSGAGASATTGTAYDDVVQFEITAGAADFEVGDEFTFDIERVMGEVVWELLADSTSGYTVDGEVYLKAPGPGLADPAYVNIRTYSEGPANRYNWEVQAATGYNSGLLFAEQPGCIPSSQGVPQLLFWNSTINYAVEADGHRVVLVAYAAGQPTQSLYAGRFDAYGSPTEYPAPLFVGGTHHDVTKTSATDLSDTAHVCFANNLVTSAATKSQAHLKLPGGSWARIRSGRLVTVFDSEEDYCFVWPTTFLSTACRFAPAYGSGGSNAYPLVQVTLHVHTAPDADGGRRGDCALVGELRGVFWVPGYGTSTGQTVDAGGFDHFIFNDTNRTANGNYLAVRLTTP